MAARLVLAVAVEVDRTGCWLRIPFAERAICLTDGRQIRWAHLPWLAKTVTLYPKLSSNR
jgi:hypothetical protein